MTDTEATLVLPDGVTYRVSELSDEVREILAIRETAQLKLQEARRKAAIYELASLSAENLITQKLDAEKADNAEVSAVTVN